jgi:hypothetical protein
MTEALIICCCAALAGLSFLFWRTTAAAVGHTASLPPDQTDSYVESMVSQAETESMKNAIGMIAVGARDPWRKFDQSIKLSAIAVSLSKMR